MKWVFENHEGTKVYYSADVIERIKKIALEACLTCGECQSEFSAKSYCDINEILEIIVNEDK